MQDWMTFLEIAMDIDIGYARDEIERYHEIDSQAKSDIEELLMFAGYVQREYPDDLQDRVESAGDFIDEAMQEQDDVNLKRDSKTRGFIQMLSRFRDRKFDAFRNDVEHNAWKRWLGFLDVNENCEKKYHNTGPNCPESWLEKLPKEQAEYLYKFWSKHGFGTTGVLDENPPTPLVVKHFLMKVERPSWQAYELSRAPFEVKGGLDIQDAVEFKDEESQ